MLIHFQTYCSNTERCVGAREAIIRCVAWCLGVALIDTAVPLHSVGADWRAEPIP